MPVLARVFPILDGRVEEAREFAEQASGVRNREIDEFYRSLGVTRETWHLQPTPDGHVVIVWTEFDDNKSLELYSAIDTPVARWFKSQVRFLSGVDPEGQPEGPPTELLMDWQGR